MTRHNKILTIAIHLLCWGMFLYLPYLSALAHNDYANHISFGESFLLALPSMMMFYADYSFLAGKFLLQKRNTLMFALCNILLIAACVCLSMLIHEYVLPSLWQVPMHDPKPPMSEIMFRNSISFALIGALGVALKSVEYIYSQHVKMEKYEKEKISAELQSLKSQLNPHFLFNSLNNIYALATIDGEKTQSAIHDLSDLLRYALYKSDAETVPLEDEINFIKTYCDLMELRFDNSVNITMQDHTDKSLHLQIAPMLYIVLVENAFKHGINPNGTSAISIHFEQNDEHTIRCTVSNGNFPKTVHDKSGSGIGIENLRKRLQYLYPDKHKYDIVIQNNTYTATLSIIL